MRLTDLASPGVIWMWNWLKDPANRGALAWLGSGLVVVAAGLWTVFTYLYPPDSGRAPPTIQVEHGVAAGGNIAVGGDLNVSGPDAADKPAD